MTAQAGMLAAAVPTIEGEPTGKTTLADEAGTYGPWLAHQALDATAASIASAAARTLGEDASGVLVVERCDLLSADASYQQVRTGLQDAEYPARPSEELVGGRTRQAAAPHHPLAERVGRAAPGETPVDIAGLPGLGALPAALALLQLAKANRMTYDLATGQASTTEEPVTLTHLPDDALGYEKWAKSLVVVVALFLIFITVGAVMNLALG